ncbi:MT-A70 family protein [Capsaspora owczarzaki ATCC 30864]|nr:MT-A70 family protein [Capsaspora owczarzaki ATCC 30864]|eukprot:XP_004347573.2 MT-A70 family protein [Capsaspora owczarzaki ATCC 30864]
MEELLGENASSVTGPATDVSAIELGVPIAIVNPVAITATASNPLNTTHGSMAIPSSISGDSLTGITRAGTTTSPPDVVAHSRRLLESTNGSFSPIGRGVPTAAAVEDDPEADEADAIEVDFEPPPHCVPIKANVLEFDWASLAAHCQFDVIMMDPPWQLASNAPTRGIALTYNQLPDAAIEDIPIASLQRNGGFVFVWVINNRYAKAFDMLKRWGYRFVDSIDWVKFTVNRRLAKCHGFYLQHAKETCLIGLKGDPPPGCVGNVASDVIFSERRGNSQKPDEMYELVEALVPNGKYLEIFGRRNNLRNYWVTIGNEL